MIPTTSNGFLTLKVLKSQESTITPSDRSLRENSSSLARLKFFISGTRNWKHRQRAMFWRIVPTLWIFSSTPSPPSTSNSATFPHETCRSSSTPLTLRLHLRSNNPLGAGTSFCSRCASCTMTIATGIGRLPCSQDCCCSLASKPRERIDGSVNSLSLDSSRGMHSKKENGLFSARQRYWVAGFTTRFGAMVIALFVWCEWGVCQEGVRGVFQRRLEYRGISREDGIIEVRPSEYTFRLGLTQAL